jgi:hypothetical protein
MARTLHSSCKVRVRLAEYDAPKRGQPFSAWATEHLRMHTAVGARYMIKRAQNNGG